jgi:hypothetical protein
MLPGILEAAREAGDSARRHSLPAGLVALVALAGLCGAGAPEVRGDAIIYHITEALLFVVNRGHVGIPSSALTYIPQNQQLLYALGLLLGTDSLAKLFHWAMGVLVLLGTYVHAADSGCDRRDALAGVALVALFPMWMILATSTYIDLATANYALAGVYLLVRRGAAGLNERERIWQCAAAGALFGAAMGTKYTAGLIAFLPALPLVAILPAGGSSSGTGTLQGAATKRILKGCAAMAIAATVLFSPWLIRNLLWTGNPFAPSFLRLLGPQGVPAATLDWPDIRASTGESLMHPARLLSAYVNMFLAFSDYGNYIPMLALILGGACLAMGSKGRATAFPSRVKWILVFLCLAFLLGVPTAAIRRDSRYVIAHMALAAVLAVFWFRTLCVLVPAHARVLNRLGALVLVVMFPLWAVSTWLRFADLGESLLPIWTGSARHEYRRARLDGYDANLALSGRILPAAGKILGAAYPSHVNYVLGGMPLTPDFAVQRTDALTSQSIAGLRRQGVSFLFGEIQPGLLPHVSLEGRFGGVPLWKLAGD